MAGITKEQVLEFIRNNDLDLDESYPRSDWWKFRDERDAYKKQRDELINDMAEIKRKAKAFNEIKEMINWFEDIKPCEFETQVVRVRKIIDDLERGAFNSHPNNVKLQREIVEVQEIKEEQ